MAKLTSIDVSRAAAVERAGICQDVLPALRATYPRAVEYGPAGSNISALAQQVAQQSAAARDAQPKDYEKAFGTATRIAQSIPEPTTQIVTGIISGLFNLFNGLFGGGCNPKDECISNRWPDGRINPNWHHGRRLQCCIPKPKGWGVLFIMHAPGYRKYPTAYAEFAAGDYVSAKCCEDLTPDERKRFPNHGVSYLGVDGISTVAVPEGWSARVYTGRQFTGEFADLAPGVHDLSKEFGGKFNDRVGSVKVRGWWMCFDTEAYGKLRGKAADWVTAKWDFPPSEEDVVALIKSDPCRPAPPAGFDTPVIKYQSFWRPGWEARSSALSKSQAELAALLAQEQQAQARAEMLKKTLLWGGGGIAAVGGLYYALGRKK